MNGRSSTRVAARAVSKLSRRAWAFALGVLIACLGAAAVSAPASGTVPPPPEAAALPDPLANGPYNTDRSYYNAGNLQLTVTSTGAAPSANCPTGTEPGQSTKCPGNTFPQPLEGSVTYPTDNPSPSKVILFLHGRHAACKSTTGLDTGAGTGQVFATGECQNKTVPVNPNGPSGPEEPGDIGSETGFWPSWQGYNYISNLLASQGYTVISPSAGALVTFDGANNPIDAGAFARSEIIAASLDLIDGWNNGVPTPAPTQTQVNAGEDGLGTDLAGKLDLSSIGMMGHSRGGEAVTQFIEFNRQRPAGGQRYNLTSVFSLAPIDRNKHYPRGTNFATLLPACDGDVSTLSGANAFERGRYADLDDPFSKFQFYVEGANHNFYNTRWPSSDRTGSDPACGNSTAAQATSIRLTPSDQRLTGLATMPTFLRAFSGGETQFLPYLTDEAGYPRSACPQGPESATVHLLNCDDVVKTSYIAPAGERQDIIRPDSGVKPTTASPTAPDAAGGQMAGTGFSLVDWCNPDPFATTPAYPPATPQTTAPNDICEGPGTPTTSFNRSFGPQLALAWDGPATLGATLRGSARDASAYDALSFRASVQITDTVRNPETTQPQAAYNPRAASKYFALALVDRDGNSDEVPLADVYPGGLEATLGATNSTGQPRHEVLNGFRIPLGKFDPTAVDLSDLDRVEVRFGGDGQSTTGAIQFSSLAFQELEDEPQTASVPLEPLPGDRELPPYDGLPTDNPAASTPAGSCVDTTKPEVLVQRSSSRGHLIEGFAGDDGCAARNGLSARDGKVERIQVSVAKRLGDRRCRFVADSGELSDPTGCGLPISIIAAGTRRWTVKLARGVPEGRYRVSAMAIDQAGNRSKVSKSTTRVR